MKKLVAMFLCVLILCAVFPSFSLAQGETISQPPLTPVSQLVDASGNVIFQDKLVEDAFRNALGVPEGLIKKTLLNNMSAKQELIISSPTPVTVDLSVLQLCTNLRLLTMEKVTPSNLSAITSLKNLQEFFVKEMQFNDLRFLIGITGLTDIFIGECPCTDISAVVEMPNLVNFSIDTSVADITPLYECKNCAAFPSRNSRMRR